MNLSRALAPSRRRLSAAGPSAPSRQRRGRARAGFTLIEILVVIVVIAILATLVAPNIFQHVGAAKDATAKSQIEMLGAALDAYRLDNGRYPTTEQTLNALWEKPTIDPPVNWRAPYLRKPVPLDPWGRPYVYFFPGQTNVTGYDLVTYGADGKPGGEGEDADITSWQ
jgi:general secretion pathway protein G